MFHFEHKTKGNGGRANRKAILLSQLAWRRIFVAACHTEQRASGIQPQVAYNVDVLSAANERCKDVLLWYASLEGQNFTVGALKGTYDNSNGSSNATMDEKGSATSFARFEHAQSRTLDLFVDGTLAVHLMYTLSMHLQKYFDSSSLKFLNDLGDVNVDQCYDNAQVGSKRKLPCSQSTTTSSRGPKMANNTESAPSGTMKRFQLETLLQGVVQGIACLWAIPQDAWVSKSMPFDGDNIFSGKWVGCERLAKRGTPVVIKAFSGAEEFVEYCTEKDILDMIRNGPHTRRLIFATQSDDVVFAAIVSFLQEGTADAIGTLEELQLMGGQILEALAELHKMRIFHHDIKPANILWSIGQKRATLIDFGLATKGTAEQVSPKDPRKFSDGVEEFAMCSGIVGTEGYQAPEMLAGSRYRGKVDVYSLGITLRNLAWLC